jgi:hypothetical protein
MTAALGLVIVGCGLPVAAQAPSTDSVAIAITNRHGLTTTAEALPRLTGSGAVIAGINAELDRMDAEALAEIRQCAEDGGPDSEANRWVTQPMTGPSYVTLRTLTESYCGGAHPSNTDDAISWDLSTGLRLDWAKVIPGLAITTDIFEDMPAGYAPSVNSERLSTWYSRKLLASMDAEMVAECADVWTPQAMEFTSFKIRLDAEAGGVTVAPNFPRVIQACAETATLTPAELHELDATPAMIEAVTTAHAAGAWAPKYDDDTD